jgi:Large eukaryotic DNA virus major capsid protein/Major capsid protein N-terminus
VRTRGPNLVGTYGRMPTGGGLLQLVAQGKQDVFLTGNPQITWFKLVYRRYTNFAVESQAMFFDGFPDFGKRITCTVPRRGDLLGPLFLEITLPEARLTDDSLAAYVNSVGHALIEEISIEIGEQEIDKQTGEWMEIWSELSVPAGQRQGFNAMIGRVDGYLPPPATSPPVTATTNSGSAYQYGSVKLYIPLQFWFCKNPGLYLPLLAMQYTTIRIHLKLRSLDQLVYKGQPFNTQGLCPTPTGLQPKKASIQDLRLYGDFIHLDSEERRRFVANSHEYLIEQIQYTSKISVPASIFTATVPLEFNHPIRELLWVIQRDAMESYNEWFNFSSTSIQEQGARQDILQEANLLLDGYDRFEIRDAGYFRLVQPFQHHTNSPVSQYIYTYAFALKPEEMQPSGSLNASRIDVVQLQVYMRPDSTLPTTDPRYVPPKGNSHVRVYATNHNVLRIVNGFAGLVFKI